MWAIVRTVLAFTSMMASVVNAQDAKTAVLPRTIYGALRFSDGTLSGRVTPADVRHMGDRKLWIDQGHSDTFVSVKGSFVATPSLTSYAKAMKDGGSIEGGYANACAVRYVRGLGMLEFLRNSVDSRVSHFGEHWMGALSVQLIGWHSEEEKLRQDRDINAGKSLLDYAAAGRIQKLRRKGNILTFSNDWRDHEIEWLASGDLDHDGVEDRLILMKSWAREGSASMTETYVVTWKKRSDKCAIIQSYPEDNIVAH